MSTSTKRTFKPGDQVVVENAEGYAQVLYVVGPEKKGYRCVWITKSGTQESGWFPAEALWLCN